MQINWFIIIAQIINFFILVWLLKRFLYKPVLKAIDEREQRIAAQLSDAKAKKSEAKKEQDEFTKKNEEFDQQKKILLDKAIADTEVEKEKLIKAARNEADTLRSKFDKALVAMQENLEHEIAQKTQDEVFAIARKALTDLASVSLEEQSVNVFIKRINDLKTEEKKKFIEAFKSDSDKILVQSAFELHAKQQTEIKNAVHEILGTKSHFQFNIAPELISGIEITSEGYKLAWSISDYINSLQKSISETIKEKSEAEAKSEKKQNA